MKNIPLFIAFCLIYIFLTPVVKAGSDLINGNTLDKDQTYYTAFISKDDMVFLDPYFSSYYSDTRAIDAQFISLFKLNKKLEVVPVLVANWEVSEDGKTYTFQLRKDITWSDGVPTTAYDVVYQWKRLFSVYADTEAINYLEHVVNVTDISDFSLPVDDLGVKAIDAYTLEVKLEKEVPWFPMLLTKPIVSATPQHVIEKYEDQWVNPENIVVNGAFKLQEFNHNESIVLLKNEKYFDADNVILTSVNYRIFTDEAEAYQEFVKGNIFYLSNVKLSKYVKNKKLIKYSSQKTSEAIVFNLNSPLTGDIKVRKALAYAFNTKYIRRSRTWMLRNLAEAELVKDADYLKIAYPERLKLARKLIAEAGYSSDKPLKLKLLLPIGLNYEEELEQWNDVKSQINDAFLSTVKLELDYKDFDSYFEDIRNNKTDLFNFWAGIDYKIPHAATFAKQFTSFWDDSNGNYSNQTIDRLYETAFTSNLEERKKIWAKIEHILTSEDYVIAPYFTRREAWLISDRVGFCGKFDPNGFYRTAPDIKDLCIRN